MTGWRIAPDAGRAREARCGHLDGLPVAEPVAGPRGCGQCLAEGGKWVHLRRCLLCGHTGCCDSSPGAHAWAHAESTGHAVARSAEPGERWAWCYADELFLVPDPPRQGADGGVHKG
ncbi:UBP-type zinc finger domain-containing protein [Streptomyces sp. NPDC006529]|uniref:UBP-type zinc finger domain-containing protein n=1 Tax=Streptomyces sp. NPDC006529 TaxID=3157177 RepID=UPI0033AE248B